MNCRHSKASLTETFLSLGFAPPSNAYIKAADLSKPEKYFPLKIMVCGSCWSACKYEKWWGIVGSYT